MSVQVGDTLLGGQVVVLSVSNGLITSIRIPALGDGVSPFVLTFSPGLIQSDVESVAQAVIDLLG